MPKNDNLNNETRKEVDRFEKARASGLKTILFVCTGNAVRSQMAEGIVNHFLSGVWTAFSAGVMPMEVPKDVIKVMREIGIDMGGSFSKHVDVFKGCCFDRVVVLCSDVEKVCPDLPACERKDHVIFRDPFSSTMIAEGSCFGLKSTFRRLRDEVKNTLSLYMKDT
ncbi:MAG: arsenate reductase ArsC [Dissulfurispiraceae bacterium]